MNCIDLFKKAAAALRLTPATWNWTPPAVKTMRTRNCRI